MKETAFKARYREVPNEALYPFGHGMTYGEVSYSATRLSAATLRGKESLTVSATITNLGTQPLREVAQLYLHQRVATPVRPVRELKGFQSIELRPGESATVSFTLRAQDLAHADESGRMITEEGRFEVVIAPDAVAGAMVPFDFRRG